MIIIGANHTQTERLWLDPPNGRKGFEAGSLESFESYGSDLGEIKKVEVRKGEVVKISARVVHFQAFAHTHMNMQKNTPTLLEVIVSLPPCS